MNDEPNLQQFVDKLSSYSDEGAQTGGAVPTAGEKMPAIGIVQEIAGSGSCVSMDAALLHKLSTSPDLSVAMAGQVGSQIKMRVANSWLIAHVRTVQEFRKKHGRPPQRPYLTYTKLREQTGAKLAMIGIGNFLDEIMLAIHAADAPEKMRGLTLFVTDVSGVIDYRGNRWFEITAKNAMQYRKDVLEFDWSGVEFVSTSLEG